MKRTILAIAAVACMAANAAQAAQGNPCGNNSIRREAAAVVGRELDDWVNPADVVTTRFLSSNQRSTTCLARVTWADREPVSIKMTVPIRSPH